MKKLKFINSLEESYNELRYKTSWPTRGQVVKSALIVMVAAAIIALVVLVMDQISEGVMKLLYHI
ncbi:MAG: preprotein translocase subunit SecE [Bacteroidales bacterium]|nr:preprotein translocase subunit SecE [Bacteroidales bacterium]